MVCLQRLDRLRYEGNNHAKDRPANARFLFYGIADFADNGLGAFLIIAVKFDGKLRYPLPKRSSMLFRELRNIARDSSNRDACELASG